MSEFATATNEPIEVIEVEAEPVKLSIYDSEWIRRDIEGLNAERDRLDSLPEDLPEAERMNLKVDALFRRQDHLFSVVYIMLRELDLRYEPKKPPRPRAPRAKKVGAAAIAATDDVPAVPVVSGGEAA